MNFCNKLECFSLEGLSSLAKSLRVRPRANTRVEHLKGLTLPAYIKLGWTGLPGTNTSAYYKFS
jgi:hypothetical protein